MNPLFIILGIFEIYILCGFIFTGLGERKKLPRGHPLKKTKSIKYKVCRRLHDIHGNEVEPAITTKSIQVSYLREGDLDDDFYRELKNHLKKEEYPSATIIFD